MTKKWIAIVNRSEARIYNSEDMTKIYTLKNNLGRLKNRDFMTDKPGSDRNRSHSKASTHSLDGEKSPHDEAAKKFAKKISLYLKKRFEEHLFQELLVSAEPRMLGLVKSSMEKSLTPHVEWQRKDLVKLSDHEIKILFLGKESTWQTAIVPQSNS